MSFRFFTEYNSKPLNEAETPLVFIPGWGFDARIIRVYDFFPGRQLIIPEGFICPVEACGSLLSFLDESEIEKVDIAGWSMGANISLDFACRNEDRISSLYLLSMREKWPKKDIENIRQGISDDMSDFMKEFYRKCFLGYRKEYREFSSHLQEIYLNELQFDVLMDGLNYLGQYTVAAMPKCIDVQVVHGVKDIIAPVHERAVFPGVKETLFPHGGHAVLFDYEAQ